MSQISILDGSKRGFMDAMPMLGVCSMKSLTTRTYLLYNA